MTVTEFLQKTYNDNKSNRSRIICNDGYSISVQASAFHYCTPRVTQDKYSAVELGFPSEEDKLINSYAETDFNFTDTVYGYVPIEIVEQLIKKHGGINTEETTC